MNILIISIVVGVIIGFIVVGVLKGQLKTVTHQSGAASYQVDGSLNLTVHTDTYLYQNTTRVPKPKNNK